MKSINEVNASTSMVDGYGKTVFVVIVAEDEQFGEVTVGYELTDVDESMCVYAGKVNAEDPGNGPIEEYETREEALASEYSKAFELAVKVAEKMRAE